jgi:hypothetical protein
MTRRGVHEHEIIFAIRNASWHLLIIVVWNANMISLLPLYGTVNITRPSEYALYL